MSTPKIHQIRIDFQVTEQIRRYVFVYIIEGQYCYLVDTGVFGCENHICDYGSVHFEKYSKSPAGTNQTELL